MPRTGIVTVTEPIERASAAFGRNQVARACAWRAGAACSIALNRREGTMKEFVHKYADRIRGVLSC